MIKPNPYLNQIELYKPGKSIDEVKKNFNLKKIVKLASNENPFGISEKVKEVILKNLNELHRYPDGNCIELREKLSEKLNVDIDEIIVGNGSDEIIDLTIKAYCNRKDEVLSCYPTFSYYRISAKAFGIKFREIPLANFKFDLIGLLKNITEKTKIIFICNPNNPTGTYLTFKELSEFIDKLNDKILVVIDEAYFEFYEKEKIVNGIEFIKKFPEKNILILRTFSKIFGLAGLRVGYGISKKEIIENLYKVKSPFNVNKLAQVCAIQALEDRNFLKKVYENNLTQKKKLYKFFDSLNIDYLQSQTNFIFFDPKIDNELLFNELLKKGVIIRSLRSFGYSTAMRISIGLEDEIKFFIENFKNVYYYLK